MQTEFHFLKDKLCAGKTRMVISCVLISLIVLYAVCLQIEKYAIAHVEYIIITSCNGEKIAVPLKLPVMKISADFDPDDASLVFQSGIRIKSLSPLPSPYYEKNTCMDAVASKNSGKIKVSMYYVFLNRSYLMCEYEVNHFPLWKMITDHAQKRWSDENKLYDAEK